ncbi:hypothetical protein [Mycolicibacter terrae]|nr:hypothetical protein [Mycolicibacter terrae]
MVKDRSAGWGSLAGRTTVGGRAMGKLSRLAAALCALPGGLVLAGPAHASGDAISGYVDDHGGEVCAFMTDQPNLAGVKHAVNHILETSGLPQDQTGQLLAGSVMADCPQYGELVEEFIWYVHHRQQQQNGGIGLGAGAILGK